jgi:hypothetical protein
MGVELWIACTLNLNPKPSWILLKVCVKIWTSQSYAESHPTRIKERQNKQKLKLGSLGRGQTTSIGGTGRQ